MINLDEYNDWPKTPIIHGTYRNIHGNEYSGFFTRDKSGNYRYHPAMPAGVVTPRNGQFSSHEPLFTDKQVKAQRAREQDKLYQLSTERKETLRRMTKKDRATIHRSTIRTLRELVGTTRPEWILKRDIEQLRKLTALLESTYEMETK